MAKTLSMEVNSFLTSLLKKNYGPDVAGVADLRGQVPSEDNNYLMSKDGNKFEGVFHDPVKMESFSFVFTRTKKGWSVKY